MAKNFELKNGHVFVLAEAAGGVYNGDQLRKISEVAEEDSAILKLTEDQRIGFMLAPDRLAHVQKVLSVCGIALRHYRSGGASSPAACLGDLCPNAHQDALGDAMEVSAHFFTKFPDAKGWVSIGMNGCEQNCLGSGVYDVHITGEESGYKIYIGGRSREIAQVGTFLTENVSRERLPEVIERILEVYYKNRESEETLSDVTERMGFGVFMSAVDGMDSEGGVAALGGESDSVNEMVADEPAEAADVSDDLKLDDAGELAEDLGESEILDDSEPLGEAESLVDDSEDALLEDDDPQTSTVVAKAKALIDEDDMMNVPVDDLLQDDEPSMDSPEMDVALGEPSQDLDVDINDTMQERLDESEVVVSADEDVEELEIDEDSPLLSEDGEDSQPEVGGIAFAPVTAAEGVDVDEELREVVALKQEMARQVNGDVDDCINEEEDLPIDDQVSDASSEMMGDSSALSDDVALDAPVAEAQEFSEVEESLSSGSSSDEDLALDEEAVLQDEGDMALEEATSEDVARMTQAIRSEIAVGRVTRDEQEPMVDPSHGMSHGASVDPLLQDTGATLEPPSVIKAPPVAAKPQPKTETQGRLKLKMGDGEVGVVLPNGVECAIPLDFVESQGSFEMDVGDETLSVEKTDKGLLFRYGSLSLTVPVLKKRMAA